MLLNKLLEHSVSDALVRLEEHNPMFSELEVELKFFGSYSECLINISLPREHICVQYKGGDHSSTFRFFKSMVDMKDAEVDYSIPSHLLCEGVEV